MILFTKQTECCGCGLCASVCPHAAITLAQDGEGFAYPVIDPARCTDCGLCKQACSFQNPPALHTAPDCYAARHTDAEVLAASSSGGVFSALASHALDQSGTVLGAVFDERFDVRHAEAHSDEALPPMRGSKYLPSSMDGAYPSVERALRANRHVLFTGTPCQVAAVRRWAEVRRLPNEERLLTMDVLCHGVASPAIWHGYLADVAARHGMPAHIAFRSKDKGWSHRALKLTLADGCDISGDVNRRVNFFTLWTSQCMTRPACHACPFATERRTGDFSAGDFVGIEKLPYAHDAEEGVSVLLANSARARALAGKLPLALMPVTLRQCEQPSLAYQAPPPRDRERFWALYRAEGYAGIVRRYGRYTPEKWLVYKIIVPVCKLLGIYALAARIYLKRGGREAKP